MTGWVTSRLGAAVLDRSGAAVPDVDLALRRNPRRAHLLVSGILGKHVPVAVSRVHEAGRRLGLLVPPGAVVVGFAETATALGHVVAATSEAVGYLHSTRRPVPPEVPTARFAEEHSHATGHTVSAQSVELLRRDVPLVLVDDEISTGRSADNARSALQQRWPRSTYLVASLLDSRPPGCGGVALARSQVQIPAGFATAAADLADRFPAPTPVVLPARAQWLQVPRLCAAYGWTTADEEAAHQLARDVAGRLAVARDERTLVLGDEEHLWFPQLVAAALGPDVRTSSTTRSPAVAIDEPGYPLRTAIAFPSTADPGRLSFAYNVVASRCDDRGNAPGFDHIVLVTDESGDHESLVGQLAAAAGVSAHVVAPC